MYTESRKIHLIEEVLKVDNDTTLHKLEEVLKRSKHGKADKPSAHDFVGVWSKKDAALIEQAINADCEKINADDWR